MDKRMLKAPPAAVRRQRIVAAAAAVFSERGYSGASMAQIAAAAGASKETLYSHFGDKPGLLRAVLISLVSTPDAAAVAGFPAEEPADAEQFESRLGQIAQALVTDLMQPTYLALIRIVVAETPRDPSLADQFRAAVADRAFSGVAATLQAGQKQGLVDPDVDIEQAARALVGSLLTYVLLDGLLRPAAQIHRPSAAAVRGQVGLFHQAISPHPNRKQESP